MSYRRQNYQYLQYHQKDFRSYQSSDPRRIEKIVQHFSVPFQPKGASLSKIRRKVEIQKYCEYEQRKRYTSLESTESVRQKSVPSDDESRPTKGTFKLMTIPSQRKEQTQHYTIAPNSQSGEINSICYRNEYITQSRLDYLVFALFQYFE